MLSCISNSCWKKSSRHPDNAIGELVSWRIGDFEQRYVMKDRSRLLMVAAVIMVMGVVVWTRSAPAAQAPPDPMTALLQEVRALRAEVGQASRTSIRMQLLVARLGLQEGRISTLANQLANVRQQLTNAQSASAPFLAQKKEIEAAGGTWGGPGDGLKPVLDAWQKQEQALRAQEAELDGLLNVEQGRWEDFNQRIDDLERTLPGTVR
jgi:hypothetical protein